LYSWSLLIAGDSSYIYETASPAFDTALTAFKEFHALTEQNLLQHSQLRLRGGQRPALAVPTSMAHVEPSSRPVHPFYLSLAVALFIVPLLNTMK
jgi:hypothetical protein